jgi:hypothetical protein
MAKKKVITDSPFVLYNVVYQDGSLSSNRRIPRPIADGFDAEANSKNLIETQDREIAEKSGRPRGPIKTITRLPGQ